MDKLQWKQYWREQRLSKKEIWKNIEGYGMYQASNMGRIKNVKTNKILSPGTDGKGYKIVCIFNGEKGKRLRSTKTVHRIVLSAFIPNNENKPQVNHKDRNRANNLLDNLEWNTASENVLHSFRSRGIIPKRIRKRR